MNPLDVGSIPAAEAREVDVVRPAPPALVAPFRIPRQAGGIHVALPGVTAAASLDAAARRNANLVAGREPYARVFGDASANLGSVDAVVVFGRRRRRWR